MLPTLLFFCFGLFLDLARALASPQSSQKPFDESYFTSNPIDHDFDALVEETLKHLHIPGMSIAIVDGQETYAKGYGIATFPDTAATPETMYYTGSTTKSFTAAALSMVIDDSASLPSPLKWTTTISSLIRDDFVLQDEYATAHITLEDALSHRTGMPRHDISLEGPNATVLGVVRKLRYLPASAELRTTMQYNNMMYVVAGYVLETLTGMWLGDFLRERIWEPLSMSSTYFSLKDAQNGVAEANKSLARGYFWENNTQEYIPEEWDESPDNSGDGAVISNVLDYAKYLRSMMFMTGPISPQGHLALRTPRSFFDPVERIPNTGPTTYALGWMQMSYRGQTIIFHGGAIRGFGAIMVYLPWRRWGLAIMANTMFTSNAAEQILMFALLDDLLDTPQQERIDWRGLVDAQFAQLDNLLQHGRDILYPNAPKHPVNLSLPLKDYTGTYTHPAYGTFDLKLVKPDQRLPFLHTPEHNLHADMLDRASPYILDLEHINGEFFLGYAMLPKTNGYTSLTGFLKAEFRLKDNGQVDELGLGLEPMMGEEKIWFKRTE